VKQFWNRFVSGKTKRSGRHRSPWLKQTGFKTLSKIFLNCFVSVSLRCADSFSEWANVWDSQLQSSRPTFIGTVAVRALPLVVSTDEQPRVRVWSASNRHLDVVTPCPVDVRRQLQSGTASHYSTPDSDNDSALYLHLFTIRPCYLDNSAINWKLLSFLLRP